MTLSELYSKLKATELPVAYRAWPEQCAPPLPFICYLCDGDKPLFADGGTYLISGLNRIPGVNIGSIGQIPMLASGGTVWSGSAIVGEAGPELLTVDGGKAVVQPLSVNTNKIEGLLGDINGRLGSDEPPIPIKIQLTLDGNVIGETALKYSRMKGRAYGN